MADKVQVNYSVEVETKVRIDEFGRLTKRSQGNVIDWLVSEAWDRLQKELQEKHSADESLKSLEHYDGINDRRAKACVDA